MEFHVQYELEEPPPPSPDGDKNFLAPPLLGNPGYAPDTHNHRIKVPLGKRIHLGINANCENYHFIP